MYVCTCLFIVSRIELWIDCIFFLGYQASENIWAFFAAHPKPLPSLPLAPPSPPIEECPDNGDLNLDNVKNIQDVLLLLQEIVDG